MSWLETREFEKSHTVFATSTGKNPISIRDVSIEKITPQRVKVVVRLTSTAKSEWPTISLDRATIENGGSITRKFTLKEPDFSLQGDLGYPQDGTGYIKNRHEVEFSTNEPESTTSPDVHYDGDLEEALQAIREGKLSSAREALLDLAEYECVIPYYHVLRAEVKTLSGILDSFPYRVES